MEWLAYDKMRWIAIGSAALCIALTLLAARRGLNAYRQRFVQAITLGLRLNFVLADPQTLFALSFVCTLTLSVGSPCGT